MTGPEQAGDPAPGGRFCVHGLVMHGSMALPDHLRTEPPTVSSEVWHVSELPPGPAPDTRSGAELLRMEIDGLLTRAVRQRDVDVLEMPGFQCWTVDSAAHTLTVSRDPATPAELVAVALTGVVAAFVVTLLGDVALHASAVETAGGVIAFAGPSGCGKSTSATLAASGGATLFADDVLRLTAGPSGIDAHRGVGETRLRPAAFAALGDAAITRSTADGRVVASPIRSRHARAPLRAIAVPVPSWTADEVVVTTVAAGTAFTVLHSCLRLSGWRHTTFVEQCFDRISTVASRVPVLRVEIPWGRPFPAGTGDAVLDAVKAALS